GMAYDSSLIVNPQGWPYAGKDFGTRLEWEPAHPPYPFRYHGGLVELPVVSEYTWYLSDDHSVARAWELLTRDHERVAGSSRLLVVMTHFYAMTGPYRRGIELYERFFDHAESRGAVRYRTVAEAAGGALGPWPLPAPGVPAPGDEAAG
ncbi:MAG TPA: hypothetical protein VHN78_07760, partial [Chloroflexota bacterium]|nr:hypothetical protein [Chloroflexota bacterium]